MGGAGLRDGLGGLLVQFVGHRRLEQLVGLGLVGLVGLVVLVVRGWMWRRLGILVC